MSAQREQWDERFAAMTAAEERAGEALAAAQQKAASLLADAVAQAEDEAQRIRGHDRDRHLADNPPPVWRMELYRNIPPVPLCGTLGGRVENTRAGGA